MPRGSVLLNRVHRRSTCVELVIVDQEQGGLNQELLAELNEKVGVGLYHLIAACCLFGVLASEYAELIVINAIGAGLQSQWGISDFEKASLVTIAFAGMTVGTYCSGQLADYAGRRWIIVRSYCVMSVVGTVTAFAINYPMMACLRLINGFACGLGVPASFVMLAEICPTKYRAAVFALPSGFATLGQMYGLAAVSLFMPDLTSGNWRAVTLVATLPSFVLGALSILFLHESIHWLAIKGQLMECRSVLLSIAKMNGTLDNIKVLTSTQDPGPDGAPEATVPEDTNAWQYLFSYGTLARVAACGFLSTVSQVLYHGMTYFWPYALSVEHNAGITGLRPSTELMLISSFGLPAVLFTLIIMQSPLGHRWTLFSAGLLMAFMLRECNVALFQARSSYFLVTVGGITRMLAQLFLATIYVFVNETFPTSTRGLMVGISMAIGRSGPLLSPMAVQSFGINGFLIMAGVLSGLSSFVALAMSETKGKQLEDFVEESDDKDVSGGVANLHDLHEKWPLMSLPEGASESGSSEWHVDGQSNTTGNSNVTT